MTITRQLAPLATVFLSGYVRHLRLRGVFGIHVVLQPFRRYPCHPHNPRQRHAFQQQPVDQGFGLRSNRSPRRILHELLTTILTGEFRFPIMNMPVPDHPVRPATWAAWHPFVLALSRSPILHHYLFSTTNNCAVWRKRAHTCATAHPHCAGCAEPVDTAGFQRPFGAAPGETTRAPAMSPRHPVLVTSLHHCRSATRALWWS